MLEDAGTWVVVCLRGALGSSVVPFHSHSPGASPSPTSALSGCPREGACEGAAAEEAWPRQQRGGCCTNCGEGPA